MKTTSTKKTKIKFPTNSYSYSTNYLFLFAEKPTKKQQNENIKKVVAENGIIDYTCIVRKKISSEIGGIK